MDEEPFNNRNLMLKKFPPSLLSGLALLAFVAVGTSLYVFNYNLLAPILWVLLPAGLLTFAVGAIAICTDSKRAPRKFPLGALFLGSLAASALATFLLPIFIGLSTTVIPIVVLLGLAIVCVFLVRTLKAKRSAFFLILSLLLLIATAFKAFVLGFAKDAAQTKMLQDAVFWAWLGCAVIATFDSGQKHTIKLAVSDTIGSSSLDYGRHLWVIGTIVWLILLTFTEGAAENLKP